jgi:cytochrome c oxidase cbb3-type subunit 3
MVDNMNKNTEEFDPVTKDKFVEHHEFDGIRELANEPPYWLSLIFIISVLFAYTYIARYHIFHSGDLQEEEYKKEMALYAPETEESDEAIARPAEKEIVLVPLKDSESLAEGKTIYANNCAVCHLSKGEGLVGPNFTDEYWIHGGSFKDIVHTITEGVPSKGMISWKTQLSKQNILEVASYILTLQGTNPPNQKAPQGELYVAE